METLGKIFGGTARVKVMRLFLFNPGAIYEIEKIIEHTRVIKKEAKKELNALVIAGLVKPQLYFIPATETAKKKKMQGWTLNAEFPYLVQLQALLIHTVVLRDDEIIDRVSKLGRIKLIVVAGVFIQNWESRLDLMIVGDRLKEHQIQSVVRKMEAEIGVNTLLDRMENIQAIPGEEFSIVGFSFRGPDRLPVTFDKVN